MKRDIETRGDIELLLREFYSVAMTDPKIGHFFTRVAELDLVLRVEGKDVGAAFVVRIRRALAATIPPSAASVRGPFAVQGRGAEWPSHQ